MRVILQDSLVKSMGVFEGFVDISVQDRRPNLCPLVNISRDDANMHPR